MSEEILRLSEWNSITISDDNVNFKERLLDLQGRRIIEINLLKNGLKITANSRVGFESNDLFNIEIKPKIPRISILKMVSFIHDFIPIESEENANLGEGDNNLLDLLIYQWLILIEKLTPRMRQNYVTINNNERYIKGKIDFNKFAKRGVVLAETPVEYQRFEINQVLNQYIKAGLNNFKRATTNPLIVNKINLLLRKFTVISDIYLDTNMIEKIIFSLTRLEEEYKIPLSYLNWILRISGQGIGNNFGTSFWINMNTLFQQYLTSFIERYSMNLRVESEISNRTIFQYDADANPQKISSISIRPDMLVFSGNELTHIVDFKYKSYNQTSVSTSDLYQLSNYGLSIGEGIVRPLILYPIVESFSDQIVNVNIPILKRKQQITIRGVDLVYLESLIQKNKHSDLSNYVNKLLY